VPSTIASRSSAIWEISSSNSRFVSQRSGIPSTLAASAAPAAAAMLAYQQRGRASQRTAAVACLREFPSIVIVRGFHFSQKRVSRRVS
jgi:hypothetical protein